MKESMVILKNPHQGVNSLPTLTTQLEFLHNNYDVYKPILQTASQFYKDQKGFMSKDNKQ